MRAIVLLAAMVVGQAQARPAPWVPKVGDRALVVPASGPLVTYGIANAVDILEFEKVQDAADDQGLAEMLESKEATVLEGGTKVLVRGPAMDLGFQGRWSEVRVETGKQAGHVGFVLNGRLERVTSAPKETPKAKGRKRRR